MCLKLDVFNVNCTSELRMGSSVSANPYEIGRLRALPNRHGAAESLELLISEHELLPYGRRKCVAPRPRIVEPLALGLDVVNSISLSVGKAM